MGRQTTGSLSWSTTVKRLLLVDFLISIVLIFIEPTYIFDWDAYMEQVAQVRGGEYDYSKLHGDTGPLVYPAGFVWLFMLLKSMFQWDHKLHTTEYIPKNFTGYEDRTVRPYGKMIALQLMFTLLYLCGNGIIATLYERSKTMPWWSLFLLVCSRRIHSVFVLGLFNDCWATVLLVVSLYYIVKDRWEIGEFSLIHGLLLATYSGATTMHTLTSLENVSLTWCLLHCFLLPSVFSLVFLFSFNYSAGLCTAHFQRLHIFQSRSVHQNEHSSVCAVPTCTHVPAFQLATIHRAHWYMCVCAGRSCSTVLGVSPIEIHCWCI